MNLFLKYFIKVIFYFIFESIFYFNCYLQLVSFLNSKFIFYTAKFDFFYHKCNNINNLLNKWLNHRLLTLNAFNVKKVQNSLPFFYVITSFAKNVFQKIFKFHKSIIWLNAHVVVSLILTKTAKSYTKSYNRNKKVSVSEK